MVSDALKRLTAALADRYAIEEEIGAGGMATVYLAHDVKHDRKVAVKVLRPELAAVLGAERFVQEIKTTANLQHPHILPLFDSGEADGFLYYVMPFIDGETVRDKLNRETQFGIDEAVRITTEVADALDYAHRNNVIHRDIKPENILLHDGRPMVADFGIALAVSAAAGGRMTETGLSLGTPHYMSPEQATAEKDLTNRSDIYSLGCVLYEMLTGEPPHMGNSAQQIIMKIVTDEARPVTELRKSVPPHVAAATANALEKLPADRFTTAIALAEALANPSFAVVFPATSSGRPHGEASSLSLPRWVAWAVPLIGVVLVGLAAWGWMRPRASEAALKQLAIPLPSSVMLEIETWRPAVAISPDGSRVVYVANRGGRRQLYLRELAQDEVTPIPGTEDGYNPFFSPDGEWVGFFDGFELRKVPVSGGAPVTVAGASPVTRGATWGQSNEIVFATSPNGGFVKVSANGGSLQRLSLADSFSLSPASVDAAVKSRGERSHRWPEILPGGNEVLFTMDVGGNPDDWSVAVLSLETGDVKILQEGGTNPHYVRSGHLVFARSGNLFAVPFDLDRLEVTGDRVMVVEEVMTEPTGAAHYAISDEGTLVYVRGPVWTSSRRLVWVSRNGEAEPLATPLYEYMQPRLSPDGRRVAVTIREGSNYDIWIAGVARGTVTPLTRHPGEDFSPVWSPDGTRLAWASEINGGPPNFHWIHADGSGAPEELEARTRRILRVPSSWSPDGRSLAFTELDLDSREDLTLPHSREDIAILSMEGERVARSFLRTDFSEYQAMFSPDGRWLAYVSNESGRDQVYVRPYDGSGQKEQISTGGGAEPVWAPDGAELFYRNGDKMMVVEISTEPAFSAATPRVLFEKRYAFIHRPDAPWNYDVAHDGQRFLMIQSEREARVTQLNVVLNFFEELKAKVGN